MTCAGGIVGGVALSMDHLEDTGSNRGCFFGFEFVRDRAGSLLGGIVTGRYYRMHLVSHVRSMIKILGESIRRIFRCSVRIFANISCRELRRCDGSIDIGCLRHENGWVWVGGRQCLATPDDVIARFVSIGLNDCPRPVLTMISQLNRNHGIFDRVAVDGRWGLRRRRTRKHQKRYRKNTHGLSSIRAAIKTRRDFSVNTRLAIPIHYYPLSSVAHHSLKVQSRLSPPCPNRVKSGPDGPETGLPRYPGAVSTDRRNTLS
jgi:hypothetical protein